MPCYHPVKAWRNTFSDYNLKKRAAPFFTPPTQISLKNGTVKPCPLPCGKCIGCRLTYARHWAMRGYCELQMCERASFVTFTYAPRHLPKSGSLIKRHYQKLFKRMRKAGYKFTYMVAGEYGERLGRPHYHVIFFGEDFKKDSYRAPVKQSREMPLYCNDKLTKLWGKGHVVCADATTASIQYVASYITKKKYGTPTEVREHYGKKLPEFMQPSLKNAIGKSWIEKFHRDVFPSGEFVFNGKAMAPPKYFLKWYAKHFPQKALELSVKREKLMETRAHEYTPQRLAAKKEVTLARFKRYVRQLDKELAA